MEQLFNSVYSTTDVSVNPLMLIISLVSSLLLGIILAKVYKYKTIYTKEFVITLSILPMIISLIIFLVNGNLGTSVAVAGTFSLIRFRSAAGGSKELLAIFMATAIGIATGMGFVTLAIVFTLLISGVLYVFENLQFTAVSQVRRHVVISVATDFDYELIFNAIFSASCNFSELSSIKYIANETIQLDYIVDLKSNVNDSKFLQQFSKYAEVVEINISKIAKKKKTL